jgi:hypothetical protein
MRPKSVCVEREDNAKVVLKKWCEGGLDSSYSEQSPEARSCESENVLSFFFLP